MNKSTAAAVVLASGVIFAALPATAANAATVLYVGKTACSDTGAGTQAQPYCTIGAAALKAAAGTTVQVAAGTYTEMVTVAASGTASAPVVFNAAPGVTVTGGTDGFKVASKAYVTIRGFAVTKTARVGILVTSSNHITIDKNDVSYAGQPNSTDMSKGISLSGTTASTVSGNVTHNNTDAGIGVTSSSTGNTISGNESYSNARGYVRAAAGIDLRNSPNNVVTGNNLHNNEDSGLNIWTSSTGTTASNNNVRNNGDHGIDVHNTNGAQVSGNTVCKNYDSGIEMTGSLNTVLNGNASADNGINSARTSGQLRADAASAPSTKANNDKLFLSVPPTTRTVFLDWNGVKYTNLPSFQSATGQELNGSFANGC